MKRLTDSDVELVDSILPDDIFYFQLEPLSGELLAAPGWHTRFGGDGTAATVSTWLNAISVADRNRFQQLLLQLAYAEVNRSETVLRMTDTNEVVVEVSIRMAREIMSDGSARVHGIQQLLHRDIGSGIDPRATNHHDLANHIASIIGYGEQLRATRLVPQQVDYLEEMLRSAGQLLPRPSGRQVPEQVGQALGIETRQLTICDVPFSAGDLLGLLRPLLDRRRRHAGGETLFQLVWRADRQFETMPCSICAGICSPGSVEAILLDDGAVIPRDQLPHFLSRGFDATAVVPASTDEDVCDAVHRLHAMGMHIAIRSTRAETAIHLYLPRAKVAVDTERSQVGGQLTQVDQPLGRDNEH